MQGGARYPAAMDVSLSTAAAGVRMAARHFDEAAAKIARVTAAANGASQSGSGMAGDGSRAAGISPEAALADLRAAEVRYHANLQVVRAEQRMAKSTLDILA